MTEKTNPLDIGGFERSLNDSATRVSGVWVSFVIFALYLILAATTVTHRQLLLAEPVKLPVLNVDLPVFGFYLVAPLLFLAFHFYVLLQIILLNRTAAAYNAALDSSIRSPAINSSVRQRLANTLFAQIFAGSPRERDGAVGFSLRATSWITLALTPLIVLVVFQFSFLPYQSSLVTWSHRAIIVVEFVVLTSLWPLIANPSIDFHFAHSFGRLRTLTLLFVLVILIGFLATFPGEIQIRALHLFSKQHDICDQPYLAYFNRLNVSREQLINTERLSKIEAANRDSGLAAYEGERTIDLSKRNLSCAQLDGVDLRRADLREANLRGASLEGAILLGAELSRATLLDADLSQAKLEGANLHGANAAGAIFYSASLRGALMSRAKLNGASLGEADLQGADLTSAELYDTDLDQANLRAATFDNAFLIGARLSMAKLDGASLTYLQASDFSAASLRATYMVGANLQGAMLNNVTDGENTDEADLTNAWLRRPILWHTGGIKCSGAMIIEPRFGAIIASAPFGDIPATPEKIEQRIQEGLDLLPSRGNGKKFEQVLRSAARGKSDDEQKTDRSHWEACSSKTAGPEYFVRLSNELIQLACGDGTDEKFRIRGIYRNWIRTASRGDLLAPVAKALSERLLDPSKCPSGTALSDRERSELRSIMAWDDKP